jgi:hypothetical protein
MNRKTAGYWRQVHQVQSMTGTSSAIARRAVRIIRDAREWTTAAETSRHPIVVGRIVKEIEEEEEEEGEPYRDLDDFIDAYEDWRGEYDVIEVETNADY